MHTLKTAPAPVSLYQAHPSQFAVSRINIHDASPKTTRVEATPALSLTVDLASSEISLHYPAQDTMEYVQDPECNRLGRTSSTSPISSAAAAAVTSLQPQQGQMASKELPALLLKVYARDGLTFSFELMGSLLDPVQSRQGQTRTRRWTPQEGSNLDTTVDQKPQDSGLEQNVHRISSQLSEQGQRVDQSNTNSLAAAPLQNLIAGPNTGGPYGTALVELQDEDMEEAYAPTIYFAETRTEQSMYDLCSEEAFQQQLLDNPTSITAVRTSPSTKQLQKHTWDWAYSPENRSEPGSESHKAIFSFMTRSRSTGALEILTMFSLWIQHEPNPNESSSSAQLPPSMPATSARNARHWRRSAAPEKNYNNTRLPSFWNKRPTLPKSRSSLSSFQGTFSSKDGQTDSAEPLEQATAALAIMTMSTASSSIPLANETEDGPLFRATVAECEQHIRNMKLTSKRILKAAQTVLETRRAWVAAEEAFVKEMDLMKPAEALVERYLRPLSEHLVEQSEMLSQNMRDLLIEPFSRFYGVDTKNAESHKKVFEEESKDFYNFLSRYMGMKQDNTQKKQEADAKHDKKRRHFERKRQEYWNFLTEMKAGGAKGEELNTYLTNYAERQCHYMVELGTVAEELQPELSAIAMANHRRREEIRSRLAGSETSAMLASPVRQYSNGTVLTQSMMTAASSNVSLDSPRTPFFDRESFDLQQQDTELLAPSAIYNGAAINNASTPSITGIRDLDHQDIDAGLALGRRKEGFLFATSRPSGHNATVLEKPSLNWHKYWCVLSEGQLHEYSNWRKGATQPHNDPINLRIATVRTCRDQDRRFCFEVITPKFRRVYQATSAEDMNSWVNVISNAIQGVLNGTGSCRNLSLEYSRDDHRTQMPPDGKGLMAGLNGMARASMEQVLNATSLPTSLQDRVQPGQAVGRKRGGSAADGLNELGQMIRPRTAGSRASNGASQNSEQLGAQLLKAMQESHPSNTACADCGAKNPDWCVINLGILVCIECSGIHRSLGTHISKVRSLTLDTTSYTKDLFEFIRSVGNNVSNNIWERKLSPPKDPQPGLAYPLPPPSKSVFRKPVVNDPREYKVTFIRKKYVDRDFVDRQLKSEAQPYQLLESGDSISRTTDALFRAVSANDIPATIAAYAAGANLNTVQRADDQGDSGPFIEPQESPLSPAPPLPPRRGTMETYNAAEVPFTVSSPILEENTLDPSLLEDTTAASETSSQLSKSTMKSYPTSFIEHSDEIGNVAQNGASRTALSPDQKQVDSLEIRPRPVGAGRPISSVMVLQTSPLLIALRHGVPFTLDDRFEVYPLAEFLILNGAASNMSMKVRFVQGDTAASEAAVSDGATVAGSGVGTGGLKKNSRMESNEFLKEGVIERDISLLPSSSIGSRLSAGSMPMELDGAAVSVHDKTNPRLSLGPTVAESVDKSANRRSVGQIVELRGEEAASAVEYLRAKSIARGEAVSVPTAFAPGLMPNASGGIASNGVQSWQGGSKLRPSSLKDMHIAGTSASPMSNIIANKPTASPRLRPSGPMSSTTDMNSLVALSAPAGPSGRLSLQYDSRTVPANPVPSYPPPTWANSHPHQDISSLFQKRRDSDGASGLGSSFFSIKRPASSASSRDKDRASIATAKAQTRRLDDYSVRRRPMSMVSSFSHHSDASSIHLSTHSPPSLETDAIRGGGGLPLSFADGHSFVIDIQNGGDTEGSDMGRISPNASLGRNRNSLTGTRSRTQKVKASLTKSIRLSAKYFRNSVIKDDDKDKVKLTDGEVKSDIGSRESMSEWRFSHGHERGHSSGSRNGKREESGGGDDEDEEELTMAELLARQDEREPKRQKKLQHEDEQVLQLPQPQRHPGQDMEWTDVPLVAPAPSVAPASPLSFFSSLGFSSTPTSSSKR
ncbi:hypothetical protein EDD11_002336 [Mortierella claussenii]|nr:hypothetical protein EDD11_002336 [Mortierella claussenii]